MPSTLLTADRVLFVEDDDVDFMAFYRAVKKRGLTFELQRARNAAEGLEMLRLQKQDGRDNRILVVLDLNMPCRSGIEFLAELRADPQLGSTVVFAFTTSSAPDDVREAYRHHVAAYLVKEVMADTNESLLDLIEGYRRSVVMPVV